MKLSQRVKMEPTMTSQRVKMEPALTMIGSEVSQMDLLALSKRNHLAALRTWQMASVAHLHLWRMRRWSDWSNLQDWSYP